MVSSLLLPENQEKLIRIPKYHVIPGRLSAMDVGNIAVPQMARTANGQRLPIRIENGEFRVGGNLVNIVDRVIIPKQLEDKLLASQAYREQDVQGLNAGADARANSKLVFEELLKKADSLGGQGQMAMYQMGVGQRLVFRVHPRAQNQSQRSGNRDLARDSWRLLRFRRPGLRAGIRCRMA